MGTRGPVPKRANERLGHTSKESFEQKSAAPNELEEMLGPEAPEWLDGFARDLYDSARTSGQATWYTPSDWATLAIVCRGAMEFIRRPTAMMLGSVMAGLNDLVFTEGARRRANIELERSVNADDPDEERADSATSEWVARVAGDDENASVSYLFGGPDGTDPDAADDDE